MRHLLAITLSASLLTLTACGGGDSSLSPVPPPPPAPPAVATSAFQGVGYHCTITGPTHTGSFMDVFDGGTYYGVPMDGGCAQLQSSITFRQNLYATQYANAQLLVTPP